MYSECSVGHINKYTVLGKYHIHHCYIVYGVKLNITKSAGSLEKYDIPSPLATAWLFAHMSTNIHVNSFKCGYKS